MIIPPPPVPPDTTANALAISAIAFVLAAQRLQIVSGRSAIRKLAAPVWFLLADARATGP